MDRLDDGSCTLGTRSSAAAIPETTTTETSPNGGDVVKDRHNAIRGDRRRTENRRRSDAHLLRRSPIQPRRTTEQLGVSFRADTSDSILTGVRRSENADGGTAIRHGRTSRVQGRKHHQRNDNEEEEAL